MSWDAQELEQVEFYYLAAGVCVLEQNTGAATSGA